MRRDRSKVAAFFGISAFFALLSPVVLYGYENLAALRTTIFSALGDELINLVFVDRISGNLFEGRSLMDGRFFYPYGNSLTFSENLLLPSLVYRFWHATTGEKILSYHLMLFSSLGMNAGAMYVLAREFWSRATAVLAALFFAFSMVRLAQISHVQLFAQWGYPLFALCCWRYHRERKSAWMFAAGFCLSAQFYSGIYLGLMLGVGALPYFYFEWERGGRRFSSHLGLLLATVSLLVLPMAIPYYRMSAEFGVVREIDEARQYAAYLWSYLSPSPDSVWSFLSRWMGWGRHLHEKRLFLGFLFGAFLVYATVFARREARKTFWGKSLGISALFSVWLSLGPNAVLYAVFYYLMPGFKAMRCPARFGFVALFAATLIAGWGLERILSRWKSRGQTAAALLIAILFLAENRIAIPLVPVPRYLEGASAYLATKEEKEPVVHLPVRVGYVAFPGDRGNLLNNREAVRMFYGLTHGHPIANGYSGFFPPRYYELLGGEDERGPTEKLLPFLREIGVRYVVLEKAMIPDETRPQWLALKGSRPCDFEDSHVCVFSL